MPTLTSYIPLFLFIVSLPYTAAAYDSDKSDTSTCIFNQSFRTLQINNTTDFLAPPILDLNGNDKLIVSFDQLADEASQLKYSLIHCTYNWHPSQILDTEYLDSFNEAKVYEYDYSLATLTNYIHYSIEIPGDLQPLKSGNYLLVVTEDFYPYDKILQVRFSVSENSLSLAGKIDPKTDIDYLASHQQLSVIVDTERSLIENPYTDIILTVEQNRRPETLRTLVAPTRVEGKKAIFEHLPALIFDAGNEYRRFEIVDLQYPGMGVENIVRAPEGYTAHLSVDIPKASDSYVFDQTQNGKFLIREYNSDNSDINSEYVDVIFTLEMPQLSDYNLFIEGDLTDRRLDYNSKMDYDASIGSYTKTLNLKQGSYNYQYIAQDRENPSKLLSIDGNKYQTRNEYIVKAYYRKRGELFDRLGAVALIRFE